MKNVFLMVMVWLAAVNAHGQDDLLKVLGENQESAPEYVVQTFNATRIINGQSVETKGKGGLEFIFSHRFGRINSGSYNFWGLDDAFVRLGLEYGVTDRLGVGIGRVSTDKTFDGFVRYKALRQRTGVSPVPITLTIVGAVYYQTSPQARFNPQVDTNDRTAYSLEILVGKKIAQGFSLQVSPVWVHRNTVNQALENNDDLAVGIGGRYKLTRSLSVTGEYFYRANAHSGSPNFDAMGVGFDIETGGHVFQLVFTNSLGLTTRPVVTATQGDFFDGDIHFGFNITRNFQLAHGKK